MGAEGLLGGNDETGGVEGKSGKLFCVVEQNKPWSLPYDILIKLVTLLLV